MHNKESNPRSYQQILWKKPTQKTLKKSGVKKGILTNMHIDMDYETLTNELPNNVEPAFDGMKIISKSTAIKE